MLGKQKPRNLILIGFVCVLLGAALPFLMVIKVLESTFFLNFLAYGAQVLGLVLGVVGVASQMTEGN